MTHEKWRKLPQRFTNTLNKGQISQNDPLVLPWQIKKRLRDTSGKDVETSPFPLENLINDNETFLKTSNYHQCLPKIVPNHQHWLLRYHGAEDGGKNVRNSVKQLLNFHDDILVFGLLCHNTSNNRYGERLSPLRTKHLPTCMLSKSKKYELVLRYAFES